IEYANTEPHIVCTHRLPIMPARPWVDMKCDGQGVRGPFPAIGKARREAFVTDRVHLIAHVRKALVELLAYGGADSLLDVRRKDRVRVAGNDNHHRATGRAASN